MILRKLFLFLLCTQALNAESFFAVSNREPLLDEIGYRPANRSTATFNPPSFAWLHEKQATVYFLQWASTADFADAVTITNLSFNCYTHNQTLKPGTYFWRYRYQAASGEMSDWSVARQFALETNIIEFPMPSKEERVTLIPKNHPRLFVRPEDLSRLRDLAHGREAGRFAELRKAANKLAKSTPPAEPAKRGSARNKKDLEAIENWWPNRERALLACTEAETVAFVYLITGEKKYGDAARKRVLELAKWDPDGPTNFELNCEAAKPMLHRISRAYDWAFDVFSPSERTFIQNAIKRRIQDAWLSGEVGRGVGHINRPLSSHGNRTWHKIGESGIVFLGEIPEAETWLDYALNKFYACYPVWSDEDGGWHEGGAYFAGYMSKAVWWLQAAQSALNIDGFKKPFFAEVGDFPLYMAPPFSPNIGFGDLSYHNRITGWGGFMEYFIRASGGHSNTHAPYWRWWAEQCGMKPETGVLGFLYNANLPAMPPAKAPADLPESKIFQGTGVASLHTSLLNRSNDIHLLFKSSPFGSQSHGHNSQNTFQLNAYGDALLTGCNYRDLYGSDFHLRWVHQTISQNGVLVNGKGQMPHSAKSRGQILDFELTPNWDYVVGDAAEAYEGRVQRFHRHILFFKPEGAEYRIASEPKKRLEFRLETAIDRWPPPPEKRVITQDDQVSAVLIYDDLVTAEPAQFQFMLHALSSFSVNKKNGKLHVQQPNAGVTVLYLSPQPQSVKFRQWDGFEPKTIRGTFPNQWHMEAATTHATSNLGMLTLIVPHRGKNVLKFDAQRLESETAIGVKLVIAGKNLLLGFRKHGAKADAELAGVRFEKPVLIK